MFRKFHINYFFEDDSEGVNPLTPTQQVCIALHHFESQPFPRSGVLSFNCRQSAYGKAVDRITGGPSLTQC